MPDRPAEPSARNEASLIEANAAFYRALESLDPAAMAEVWEASERAFCVHPGWQALHGYEAVQSSWRAIITNTGRIGFTLTAVQAHVAGDVGVVTCYENIRSEVAGEPHTATAIATNLFAYDPETGWKLFHHHASLTAAPKEPRTVN